MQRCLPWRTSRRPAWAMSGEIRAKGCASVARATFATTPQPSEDECGSIGMRDLLFHVFLLGCAARTVFADHVPPKVFEPSLPEAVPLVEAHKDDAFTDEQKDQAVKLVRDVGSAARLPRTWI